MWGGAQATGAFFLGDGAAYDPAADRWRPLPAAPGRFIPTAQWSGRELLVWAGIVPTGGASGVRPSDDGARLTP